MKKIINRLLTVAVFSAIVMYFGCQKAGLTSGSASTLSTNSVTTTATASTVALPSSPFITGYVEVNSNNFSNVSCYLLSSNNNQAFTIANIFAANINADPTTGAPVYYANAQVQSVLNSGAISNLHSRGIKVLLDILGNHENAGWSCFTSYSQADAFAAQLASVVNQYNLDGIDIDDEYSACSSTNNSSLVMAVTALRARLGTSKLITSTTYNTVSQYGVSYNGQTLGTLLDLIIDDAYFNNDYAGRMAQYTSLGISKSKLMLGWHFNLYNDGNAAASFVKNNGFAGLMAYGVTDSIMPELSSITNPIYGTNGAVVSECLDGAAGVSSIVSGDTYQIVSAVNNYSLLDVYANGTTNGTKVILWSGQYTEAKNETWTVTSVGGGYYTLSPPSAPGLCLDDAYSGATNGNTVWIYGANGSNAQKWLITPVGNNYFTLSPACAPGYVLDDQYQGTANGNPVWLYQSNGTVAQQWKFIR